jgi:hypothetical protein
MVQYVLGYDIPLFDSGATYEFGTYPLNSYGPFLSTTSNWY